MKASILCAEKNRFDLINSKSLNIQLFGTDNDYPQKVIDIVFSSVSGKSCFINYSKFINGNGFADEKAYQLFINNSQTLDDVLHDVSRDFALFGGFCLHVNYNADYKKTTISHVPFENARFQALDEEGNFTKIALHPDWGRRNLLSRRWRREDIDFIDLYNPSPEVIEQQVAAAGGWDSYKGQIFYYSNEGAGVYPTPIFDEVLTDMNTEEAISDITNRNATRGFLPSGFFIDILNKETDSDDGETDAEKVIKQMQGSRNANKVGYMSVNSKEEIPEFLKISGNTYDKEFTVSREAVKDAIGRAFTQPPILRCENVGAGFGSELMEQAYDYYNSTTSNERLVLERVFSELLNNYKEQTDINTEIQPLSFNSNLSLAERLGDAGLAQLLDIINSNMTYTQKRSIASALWDISEEDINRLIPFTNDSIN